MCFSGSMESSIKSESKWLWERLLSSGVKGDTAQSLCVIKKERENRYSVQKILIHSLCQVTLQVEEDTQVPNNFNKNEAVPLFVKISNVKILA